MPTVLITGANRGLGLEYAKQYAADGWDVIATTREPDKAEALKALSGKIEVMKLIVSDLKSIEALAQSLKDRSISIVINNAGIYGPETQSFDSMDYDKWLEVFRVNTIAPFQIAKNLLPNLLAAKAKGEMPKLCFMSSIMGSISSFDGGNYFAYASSKAALNMIGHGIAAVTRDQGIITLLLHPGWVQTDMGGKNAPLHPPESISGLRKVIDAATVEKSGGYFDYQGNQLPW